VHPGPEQRIGEEAVEAESGTESEGQGTPAKFAATLLNVVATSCTIGRRDDTIAWAISRPTRPPMIVEAADNKSEFLNGTRSSGLPRYE